MEKKCWTCGAPATQFVMQKKFNKTIFYYESRPQRGYCDECFLKFAVDMRQSKDEYVRLKKKLMYERAVKLLEKQDVDVYDYEEALKAVQDYSDSHPDKFDSAEEMLATAILIHNRVMTNVGVPVGKYTADMLLPEKFVILEVDGVTHAGRVYYDNERDKELRRILGGKWEVVRIKTEYIAKNAKQLVTAIDAVYAEKKKLRAQNNGLLPDWYSRREFAKRPKKQQYGDELLLD